MPTDEKKQDSKEETIEAKDVENSQEEQISTKYDKKKLVKYILIGIVALLTILLFVIILIFIFKSPDDEIIVQEITNTQEELIVEEVKEKDEFKFDFNNLEPEKLNEQLSLLTNKNLEITKIEEMENSSNTQENNNITNIFNTFETKEDIIDETTNIKQDIETQIQTTQVVETLEEETLKKTEPSATFEEVAVVKKIINSDFVNIINVAKIKGNLQKKYLDKIIAINPNVLLCRDDENIIEIYFGPFDNNETRDELFKKLLNAGFKESYILDMSKDEFDRRCNY